MKFLYQNTSLLSENQIKDTASKLNEYIKHLQDVVASHNYNDAEASLNLSSDTELLKKVIALRERTISSKLKYIIDIGIGGSNLGTKAIYDALFGYFEVLQPNHFPKMIFLDTTDSAFLSSFSTFVETISSKDEFIINAISKSGGTTETIANLEVAMSFFEKKFGDIKDRVVITTDDGSKMWQQATENGYDVLTLPKQVGGRFSVLSAVGLFPCAAARIDIEKILKGARTVREICISSDVMNNPAALSAIILYLQSQQGKKINDNFIFVPQLESIGKWYRQLMGESIGKEKDLQNNTVYAGITPTVSIGSTDLHSVGQLYLGGPRDKITTFIYTEKTPHDVLIPQTLHFPLVDSIAGKNISEIIKAIREGVKVAYQKQGLPYMEVVLDAVDEQSLGEFLQFKMIEMMYLGHLLNVNTFDQPHVELYKVETKSILSGK